MSDSEPTNGELSRQIASLTKSIDEGFKGVHSRQDKTNGNVIKNTEHRLKTEGAVNTLKYVVGVLGVSNIILILKVFLGNQ